MADEKKRVADEKATEKKQAADEKAVEKKRVADEKAAEKKQAAVEAAAAATKQKVLDKVAALGDKPVPETKLGKPAEKAGPAAMAVYETVLKELLDNGTLHKHGTKYGKKPLKVPKWYETAPHKARFGALLKKAKELIGGGIEEEQLLAELRRQVVAEPSVAHPTPSKAQPDVQPAVKPLVARSAERPAISLRDAIKSAYDEL